jgi:SAM-dependent methyltransferase
MNENLLQIAEWIRQHPQEAGGDLYHPLPFEEFRSLRISSKAQASEQKWRLIERTRGTGASFAGLNALDVGANAGFFSFSLAQRGARVDAFEPHEHYVSLGRRIVEATSLDVTWFQQPLMAGDLAGRHYDLALMLSVFQWISEGNRRLDHAIEVLRAVARSTRTLYFELGCNAGKSAIEVDGSALLWTWRLLRRHTAPKRVHYLGSAAAWGRARRYLFAATDHDLHLTPWQRTVTGLLGRVAPGGGAEP